MEIEEAYGKTINKIVNDLRVILEEAVSMKSKGDEAVWALLEKNARLKNEYAELNMSYKASIRKRTDLSDQVDALKTTLQKVENIEPHLRAVMDERDVLLESELVSACKIRGLLKELIIIQKDRDCLKMELQEVEADRDSLRNEKKTFKEEEAELHSRLAAEEVLCVSCRSDFYSVVNDRDELYAKQDDLVATIEEQDTELLKVKQECRMLQVIIENMSKTSEITRKERDALIVRERKANTDLNTQMLIKNVDKDILKHVKRERDAVCAERDSLIDALDEQIAELEVTTLERDAVQILLSEAISDIPTTTVNSKALLDNNENITIVWT